MCKSQMQRHSLNKFGNILYVQKSDRPWREVLIRCQFPHGRGVFKKISESFIVKAYSTEF
jgi:uncharacterized protein YlbG (UPF0298 family)